MTRIIPYIPVLVAYDCPKEVFSGQRVGWYRETPGERLYKEPGKRIAVFHNDPLFLRFLSFSFFRPAIRLLRRQNPYSRIKVGPLNEKFFRMTFVDFRRAQHILEKRNFYQIEKYVAFTNEAKVYLRWHEDRLFYLRVVERNEVIFREFLDRSST